MFAELGEFEVGGYEEAIACCNKMIEIKPNSHHAWSNRGYLLFMLGQYQEAIACCDKAIWNLNKFQAQTKPKLAL